jgi:hypothetical protein
MATTLGFPLNAWVSLMLSGTEVGQEGYVREPVTFEQIAGGVTAANTAAIWWPEAKSNWGAVVSVGVYNAPVGGLQIGLFAPITPVTVAQYERVYIPSASFQVTITAAASRFGLSTFGIGRYGTTPGLAGIGSTIGSPYNVGGYGVGPYQREPLGVLLLKTFAPVALCGGVAATWAPGPSDLVAQEA